MPHAVYWLLSPDSFRNESLRLDPAERLFAGDPRGLEGNGQSATSPAPSALAAQPAASTGEAQTTATAPTTYTLTPQRRAQAIAYSHIRYILYFLGTLISLGIYGLLWWTGVTVSSPLGVRGFAAPLRSVLDLRAIICAGRKPAESPLDFYPAIFLSTGSAFHTGLASWFGDWGKSLGLVIAAGVVWPGSFTPSSAAARRRWWFYFWLATIPLLLTLMLIEPYVIEPLFYTFTPLEKTQPALTVKIEGMLNHAGLSIPPSHIFEMDASSRTRELNAYVSGLGASKRVVVWDTTLKRMDPDELLLFSGMKPATTSFNTFPRNLRWTKALPWSFSFWDFSL